MTSQEKKEILLQYRAAEREEKRLELEIQRWRSRAEKMTSGYGGTPSGDGDGRSLENTMAHIDDLTRQLSDQRDRLVTLRREIGMAIDSVPDARLRELLRLRYIDGMTWERIAVKLDKTYQWVCKLHGDALSQIKIDPVDSN